jgi:hypothetical protein
MKRSLHPKDFAFFASTAVMSKPAAALAESPSPTLPGKPESDSAAARGELIQ